MVKRRVITVDGLAGAGKTALAERLAQRLNYAHLKTGILYRAVGYLALNHGVDSSSGPALADLIAAHTIELVLVDGCSRVLIDGEDVGERLHQPDVSEAASLAASQTEVRSALVGAQRKAFPGCNLVAEGRDLGTVIFPDADLKFFVSADVNIRVQRRLAQFHGEGATDSPEKLNLLKKEIEIEILERDRRDSERSIAPTVPAADAVSIENSSQTLTQLVQTMYDSAASRGLLSR